MNHLKEKMPKRIERLPELAYNLWWSWHSNSRELFKRLDHQLWRRTQHNPVLILQQMTAEELAAKAQDASFVRFYEHVMLDFDNMLSNGHTWFHQTYAEYKHKTIAYFSFEFGLHSSIPIYSGGLGILAGDHAKEASDLGLPFVGIGFLYPQGYFRQRLPSHGWQEAYYPQLDINKSPIQLVFDKEGNEVKISVEVGSRVVHARIWRVQVGRVPLYLMDTDVDDNDPWDRELTARLYSGDSEMRIRQEIMLGIGGVRILKALGIEPSVYHMNEGHSGFLLLENIREKVAAGMSFTEAAAEGRKQSVFTTHTPVPAGHDAFSYHLIDQYFGQFWPQLGISREEFLSMGAHEEEWGMAFNMTVLALRYSGQCNGVSKLHGQVSREMWQHVFPGKTVDEVPISSVTNGIHVPTWIVSDLNKLYNKYLGPDWIEQQDDPKLWQRLDEMPLKVLWQAHTQLKYKLMYFLRSRSRARWVEGNYDPTQILTSGTLLDPEALTIGFARRFATYKRAALIFSDIERLQKILLDVHRPVQIVFAGKAHPADDPGKALIQEIYNMAKHNRLGGRVAFVEDYDMHVARYLTQGVDIWLNTPRRPREASGTSGMKATLNGIPNLSILDGWWEEGYNGANGWAVPSKDFTTHAEQDAFDINAIYELLENEIVPLYYNRDLDGVPRGWVQVMRETILTNAPAFSMRRMVKEYTNNLYLTAMKNGE